MSSDFEDRPSGTDASLVNRPPAILQFLPPEYRWEFTRRHPYYLLFWEAARRSRSSPSEDPQQKALDQAAEAILLLIGVSGEPVSPATPFSELDDAPLADCWSSGAVAQLTIRGLASCFLCLPVCVRREIGQLLLDSSNVHEDDSAAKFALSQRLMRTKTEALDTFPVAPVLSVNLEAPQRAIVAAVESYVRSEKERRGISERRRRDDSLPDFLNVWDQREGWTGSTYDGGREQTLRQIAQEANTPIETVRNRYNSAFQYISGHEYSPELWQRMCGAFKIGGVFGALSPQQSSIRRPTRSRSKQPIPESRLSSSGVDGAQAPFAAANAKAADQRGEAELYADIRAMVSAGAANDEIIRSLELTTESANEMIDWIRSRVSDNL